MNILKMRLKRRALRNIAEIKEVINTSIQPFKEIPSVSTTGKGNPERINAHDLFSLYTADIIKEDIVFVR